MEDGDVGVYAEMMWFVRTVRGAILVAMVVALVASASYLLSTTRNVQSAARPSENSAASIVDVGSPAADASLPADVQVTDEPTADQPVDLSADLVDAEQAAPRAADSEPILEALDPSESEIVQLAAPAAPEQSADSAAQGKYQRSVIATLTYGNGSASLGLSKGSDRRPIGPSSFAVDAAGNLFVSDNVNGRVQVFSNRGGLVRSLKVDSNVYDLATGGASDLYLLGADGSLAIQDAVTGSVKAKGAAMSAAAEELGQLRVANGQISLESPRQITYPLGASRNSGMALLSTQEQQSGQRKGSLTSSQDRYTTSYRDGGHLYRLDDKGRTIQDIALRLSDVATVVFLQQDRAGNVYVQVERASDNGKVSVEVRQYSKKGDLLAVVSIDRVDYLPMTRSTVVAEDGTIYQLLPTAQGAALVKYQRS